ncbi:MAG: outer membrane beta-barrel protein [Candidatus Omnitrophota bacterium]
MMVEHKSFLVKLIILVIFFCFCSLSYAQGNIHLSTLEIHPFASVEQKYDDNIFLEPSNYENDDWITTTTLGVGLEMPIVPQREDDFNFKAKYAADIIEFWDETKQSRVDHTVSANADFDFANDFTLKLGDNYRKTADPPNSELTALEKREKNTGQVMLGYAEGGELSFELGYKHILDDYNTLNNLDKTEQVITAIVYYQIFPKTSVFGEYNNGKINYDLNTTNSDSKYNQGFLGLKGEIAPKLTGLAKIGYKDANYNDASKKDFTGLTTWLNLTYNLMERSTLNIYGENSSTESTYSTNSYFNSNKIGVRFDHELYLRLFLAAGGAYELNKYPVATTVNSVTAKREDDILSFSISLRYEIKEWASIQAGYEYKERDSNFTAFDYKDNKISAKAALTF